MVASAMTVVSRPPMEDATKEIASACWPLPCLAIG